MLKSKDSFLRKLLKIIKNQVPHLHFTTEFSDSHEGNIFEAAFYFFTEKESCIQPFKRSFSF